MNADPSLPGPLEAALRRTRSRGWLRRFTLASRLLLAMAFIPTGLVKLLGRRFTLLPLEHPVGLFFEAMYQTGPFWRLIGLVQVAAGVLLLIPRTTALGAALFLPVAAGIFLATWGVGFGNTVYITAGVLLSAAYLVCWDGDRIWSAGRSLLRPGDPDIRLLDGAHPVEIGGWVIGGASGLAFFLVTRNLLPAIVAGPLLVSGSAAVVLVVVGWLMGRSGRSGDAP
jgi:uncharacterized membrane protein YphA (DoxX/SURF4 family)